MGNMPHVLHVFSTFSVGGPQVRTTAVINGAGTSFRHTVMAMDGSYEAIVKIERRLDVRRVDRPRKRTGVPYPITLHRFVKNVRPDLLITYNWGAIESALGARLGSVCPVVHTEDGFGPDEATKLKLRRVLARRFILNRIHATVVPSRTLLKIALQEYKLRPEKVRLIPNGIDLERFRPIRDCEWRSRIGATENTVVFGYVGGLREEKNLALLIRAFAQAQLRNARIVLVGEGNCRETLEALSRDLGIAERVVFAGSAEDPTRYYAAFDVFVLSSATEQMPLSLLEAMACGLPAICTDVGDCREMIGGSGRLTIVPVNDVDAYGESLRAMAQNVDLRASLGSVNRSRCIAHYSLDQMIREYEALYRRAMA